MGCVRVRDPWTTLAYLRNYASNNFRADVARACNGRYAKDELVADCRLYVSVRANCLGPDLPNILRFIIRLS